MRCLLVLTLAMGIVTTSALGQETGSLRFQWTKGQVLNYQIEHQTEASDSTADSKSETKSSLKVVKQWQVLDVDENGVATLEMSLRSMVQERTTPSGETLLFDSSNPEKSTPQLKEAMSKFLNTPLAVIRVSRLGKVVEVKKSSTPAGFENELPFLIQIPEESMKADSSWERAYKITLFPPLGTGEKYDAVQTFRCKSVDARQATITMKTELKSPPATPADAVPLWQMMPEGVAVFDVGRGRLHAARLEINKELKNHQGENSMTSFKSKLTIQVLDKP